MWLYAVHVCCDCAVCRVPAEPPIISVISIADQYRERNFPGAWFLTNDGYGCGYGEGALGFPRFIDRSVLIDESASF